MNYYKTFVEVGDGDIADTFDGSLDPAGLGKIDEAQKIVRIESLVRPLKNLEITFGELKKAYDNGEAAVVEAFLRVWNESRDSRPAFAVFKDDVREDLLRADWPSRLRDRLGLAHYDCAAGPIPISLMEYTVAEVITLAAQKGVVLPFTAPTVLDSGPWPFFFPAPPELGCGRTMALYEIADDRDLLAELLHFRMTYKFEHLARLDEIRVAPNAYDLKGLRNHHLLALHVACGYDSFGEEIPE